MDAVKLESSHATDIGFDVHQATSSVRIDGEVGGLNPPPQPSKPTILVKIYTQLMKFLS